MEGKTIEEKGPSMVCVHCGHSAKSVYVEYSPGNIRLSTCTRCQSPVDEYVEYETLIVIIDAILHKAEPYRHLFFNYPELHHFNLLDLIWKAFLEIWDYPLIPVAPTSSVGFITEGTSVKDFENAGQLNAGYFFRQFLQGSLLKKCRWALQGVGNKEVIQWDSLTSFIFTAGKAVAQISCLNCTFQLVLLLAAHAWPRRGPNANLKVTHILLAVLLSSHFKLVVFAMLVWKFSPMVNCMIDMLVFSSNIIAMKVMLKSTTVHAVVAVMSGAVAKTIVGTLLGITGWGLFN